MHLLVTGTDTGVGKTFITYNLALALKRKGARVACYKPVETGVEELPQDGVLLSKATGQPLHEVVPLTFKLPLAPYSATLEEGSEVNLEFLKNGFYELVQRYDVVLVEGAGGLSVPLLKDYDYSDLAKDWGLELLIVARATLGTINHTYLTYTYAVSKGLKVKGVVMNGFKGEDISERTNPKVVYERTGVEPLKIPYIQGMELEGKYLDKLSSLVGL